MSFLHKCAVFLHVASETKDRIIFFSQLGYFICAMNENTRQLQGHLYLNGTQMVLFFLLKVHVAQGPGNQMLKLSLSLSLSHEPFDPILTVSNLVVRVGGGGVLQKVVQLK